MDACLICHGTAELKIPTGDFSHVICSECGEYKMSGTAITEKGQRELQVDATRRWLNQQRQSGTSVPLIQRTNLIFG